MEDEDYIFARLYNIMARFKEQPHVPIRVNPSAAHRNNNF